MLQVTKITGWAAIFLQASGDLTMQAVKDISRPGRWDGDLGRRVTARHSLSFCHVETVLASQDRISSLVIIGDHL